MYQCIFFQMQELVPPDIYEQASNEFVLWMMFRRDALQVLDLLREIYGVAIVNDWVWGGSSTMCGFRPFDSEVGASFSQHKFANAFDVHFREADVQKVRADIMHRKYGFMQKIRGLELEVPWLHFDCRNCDELLTFKPS